MRARFLSGVIAAAVAVTLLAGCSAPDRSNARLSIAANGDLKIDGQPSTLADLDKRLSEVERLHGKVLYYREEGRPTMQNTGALGGILGMLIKHRMPITVAHKPDFSDVVDASGHVLPKGKQ